MGSEMCIRDRPLTACGVVTTLITDMAVFSIDKAGLTLIRTMPGVSIDQVNQHTGAAFSVAKTL